MSKKKMRRDRALMEIPRLRANRRSGIMLTALGGILAVVVIMGIPVLQGYGILPWSSASSRSRPPYAPAACSAWACRNSPAPTRRSTRSASYTTSPTRI